MTTSRIRSPISSGLGPSLEAFLHFLFLAGKNVQGIPLRRGLRGVGRLGLGWDFRDFGHNRDHGCADGCGETMPPVWD